MDANWTRPFDETGKSLTRSYAMEDPWSSHDT